MKTVKNIKSKLLPVSDVIIVEKNVGWTRANCKKNNIICMQLYTEDYEDKRRVEKLRQLIRDIKQKQPTADIVLSNDVSKWYKKRTLDQNALMWSLLTILAHEVYNNKNLKDVLYEDMLDLYAPKLISPWTGKERNITSSKMNTVQMAVLIEGIFNELALQQIDVNTSQDIRKYWIEWRNWRGKQKVDPLSKTYKDLQDYKQRVNYCEACQAWLFVGTEKYCGHMAHIVSSGSGGSDEVWNRLHLCVEHHLYCQHQQGWSTLLEEFPHLKWKVDKAVEKSGKKSIDN